MPNTSFKVGDRVKAIADEWKLGVLGGLGTVVWVDKVIGSVDVKFDAEIEALHMFQRELVLTKQTTLAFIKKHKDA